MILITIFIICHNYLFFSLPQCMLFLFKSNLPAQSDLKKRFKEEPKDKIGHLNEQIEFKCSPPDGYPRPQIVWLKDGMQINQIDYLQIKNSPNQAFKKRAYRSINRLFNRNHSKARKLELMMINDSAANKSAIINKSFDSSNDQMNLNDKDLEDSEDEDQLSHSIDERLSTSNNAKILLKHNEANEDLNFSTNFVKMPDHLFILRSFRREDQGNYTCVAFNASGKRYSRTITLKGIFIVIYMKKKLSYCTNYCTNLS